MAKTITTIDEMQRYLRGVIGRADHHARAVNSIVFPLVGAIVMYKDKGTDIKVRTYDGTMANMIWVSISGNRYAFLYNHETGYVEMRERTGRAESLAEFHNEMSLLEIYDTIRSVMTPVPA